MTKMTIRVIIILVLSSSFSFSQSLKLPEPSKAFIEKVKFEDNAEKQYFSKYLGKESETVLKRFEESKDVCAKLIKYKTAIKFNRDSCSEHGTEVEITFPNYSKTEIIKFVEWFFKTDYNVWNKSKTKYQPNEDGDAGCYLEIQEQKNQILLSYYCGC